MRYHTHQIILRGSIYQPIEYVEGIYLHILFNRREHIVGLGTKIAEALLTLSYLGIPQAPGNDCVV